MKIEFTWDFQKAATNLKKHGVSFDEAKTVFEDMLAVIVDDVEHSRGELRSIIIGLSNRSRLLFVSHVERTDKIRIISARPATKQEKKDYESGTKF